MIERHDTLPDADSLAGEINTLAAEFVRMRGELLEARGEILRLRRELATRKSPRVVSGMEIGSLRRQVAYYCHPDRGGTHGLMSNLNTLFDALEGLKQAG